jgi:hypothetical protein
LNYYWLLAISFHIEKVSDTSPTTPDYCISVLFCYLICPWDWLEKEVCVWRRDLWRKGIPPMSAKSFLEATVS